MSQAPKITVEQIREASALLGMTFDNAHSHLLQSPGQAAEKIESLNNELSRLWPAIRAGHFHARSRAQAIEQELRVLNLSLPLLHAIHGASAISCNSLPKIET